MPNNKPFLNYTGLYRYQNVSGSDLLLPFPFEGGNRLLPKNHVFEGDSRFSGIYGVACIKNLNHQLRKKDKKIKTETESIVNNTKSELIIDEVAEQKIQFFESNGTELKTINESQKAEVKIDIPMTRQDLMDFCDFKKIKYQKNWNKETIAEAIKKHKEDHKSVEPSE